MAPLPASKNSHLMARRLRSAEVGRPRKNKPDEGAVLSFRVTPELRDALDAVVEEVNVKQPGRSMSRTELMKIVLYDWLKRGARLPK